MFFVITYEPLGTEEDMSLRKIVFIEDISSMIELVFILESLGLLDRIFDRRDRRDGENNILEIDFL